MARKVLGATALIACAADQSDTCGYGSYTNPCVPYLTQCADGSDRRLLDAVQAWTLRDMDGDGQLDVFTNASSSAQHCMNVYGCTRQTGAQQVWMWPCVLSRTGGCDGDQANQVWTLTNRSDGSAALVSTIPGSGSAKCLASNSTAPASVLGLIAADCDDADPSQAFQHATDGSGTTIQHVASGLCLTDVGPAPPAPPLPQTFLLINPNTAPVFAMDLASMTQTDTTWMLSIDGGPLRQICVPCGGYNSDAQVPPFNDYHDTLTDATYTRNVAVPAQAHGEEWIIEFGGVNYGAEVYVNGVLAGVHHGPMMPFGVNVTAFVRPGQAFNLTVISRPFSYYSGGVPSGFIYAETWQPNNGWASRFANGITKTVRLAAYGAVRVLNTTIIPSLEQGTVTVTTTIRNVSPLPVAVSLTGVLSSWNGAAWQYPAVPTSNATLALGSDTILTSIIAWNAPPEMLWWPNRPYHASYRAQLHWLNLTLSTAAGTVDTFSQRFGLVEHREQAFYYSINGVRFNQISDATPEAGMSYYDCYTAAAAFQYATVDNPGAQDTWNRYQRLGLTSNRIHQSTPTEAMMLAADEVGFLLKPETAIRGCPGYEPCVFGALHLQAAEELARVSMHHPSVIAYSVQNEGDESIVGPLADAMFAVDGSRPLTSEGTGASGVYINGSIAHAVPMLHYAVPPASQDGAVITGIGECAWCVSDGLEQYAGYVAAGRLQDLAYVSGWDLLNYWSNFLQGMNASRHAWHQQGCAAQDRMDGINGWDSPVVDWVQRVFHPFWAVDVQYLAANPKYVPGWPTNVPTLQSGAVFSRNISVFNDALRPNDLSLQWSLVWGAPNGTVAVSGAAGPQTVQAGFHWSTTIQVPSVPKPPSGASQRMYAVFSTIIAGEVMYTEDREFFQVSP